MTKRQRTEKFDPAAIRTQKHAWVRKSVRDTRRCAEYYGMDQRELDALGAFLATGVVDEAAAPTFAAELRADLEREGGQ